MPNAANPDDWLVETVWNNYATTDHNTFVGGNGGNGDSYFQNNSSSGGVDTTQPTPVYQVDFGLTSPAYSDLSLTGRGVPDVVAPAGGNMYFTTPNAEMTTPLVGEGGTSAATPFWAGLITQINYVFNDQGLPNLGYMTDLLYTAAVIAPGSFNDISMGNNTSSYTLGGTNYGGINPTGYGYEAGTGYDLTSGLGSPNGLLLARALTEIAHSQVYFSDVPDVIASDNSGGWTSGAAQTLLFQTTATAAAAVTIQAGSDALNVSAAAHESYAWTSQFAQQSLQSDFDRPSSPCSTGSPRARWCRTRWRRAKPCRSASTAPPRRPPRPTSAPPSALPTSIPTARTSCASPSRWRWRRRRTGPTT